MRQNLHATSSEPFLNIAHAELPGPHRVMYQVQVRPRVLFIVLSDRDEVLHLRHALVALSMEFDEFNLPRLRPPKIFLQVHI